jgi:phospholipid N-methyltransferase
MAIGQPALNKARQKMVLPSTSRRLLFARNFIKYPGMLGSLVPSSRFLVNDLLSQVNWDKATVFVEYGPGIGTITQEILKRMRPDATLVAIELNQDFVDFLRDEIEDPRLRVVCGSALDVRTLLAAQNLAHADYIVSGIPYSLIPDPTRREILEESCQLLHPEGALLVYQFTRAVLPHLQSVFRSVKQGFQPLNILPARLFYCTR